jgi:hypothetical protein
VVLLSSIPQPLLPVTKSAQARLPSIRPPLCRFTPCYIGGLVTTNHALYCTWARQKKVRPEPCAPALLNSAASPACNKARKRASLPFVLCAGLLHATSTSFPPRTTAFIVHGPDNKRRCARPPPLQPPTLRACAAAACKHTWLLAPLCVQLRSAHNALSCAFIAEYSRIRRDELHDQVRRCRDRAGRDHEDQVHGASETQKRAVGDILFVLAVALLHATLVRTHACARPWSLSKRQLALACSMFVSWFNTL